jgi:pimeloyl-ACP methyl ester carboxylesterase
MQLSELDAHRHAAVTRSGEISYLDIGTGPVALFVHGIATNAYLWRNVIAALASRRRCIAVDLPLHGRSPVTADQDLSLAALAAGLHDFCDALGLTGIDLVANDTGGAIAQILAARHPQRLATLTLTNCDTADNLPPEDFKPRISCRTWSSTGLAPRRSKRDQPRARASSRTGAGPNCPAAALRHCYPKLVSIRSWGLPVYSIICFNNGTSFSSWRESPAATGPDPSNR